MPRVLHHRFTSQPAACLFVFGFSAAASSMFRFGPEFRPHLASPSLFALMQVPPPAQSFVLHWTREVVFSLRSVAFIP